MVVNIVGVGGKRPSPYNLPGGAANAALMLATADGVTPEAIHGANMAWRVCSVAASVCPRSAPRRLTRRTPSRVRIWSSSMSPCLPWKVKGMRKRAGREPVIMGATITVRKCASAHSYRRAIPPHTGRFSGSRCRPWGRAGRARSLRSCGLALLTTPARRRPRLPTRATPGHRHPARPATSGYQSADRASPAEIKKDLIPLLE